MPDLQLMASHLNDGKIGLINLVAKAKFASSNGEARRLIKQGGVRIDGEAIQDEKFYVVPKAGMILNVGKRKFIRISL
jgi:tyrosyl-tRNA synthetase